MNVETSTVTKLLITEAPNLDPISVYLEDLAPCKGKITVSCYDKTWHAYWGGMWDGLTIGQFFCKLHDAYIIGYFDRALSSRRFSGEALADKARKMIVQMRRDRDLDAEDARSLLDEAEDVRHTSSLDECGGAHRELMHRVFGDDWWNLPADAMEPNPDWAYLCRIIATVQQALAKQYPLLPEPALPSSAFPYSTITPAQRGRYGVLMKKILDALKVWKAKHWDDQFFSEDSEHYSWMGVDRPPLRRFWTRYGLRLNRLVTWVVLTIAGALLLALLGLS